MEIRWMCEYSYMRFGYGGRSFSVGSFHPSWRRRGGSSLFGQFLKVLIAFLAHFDPLGNVTHRRIFCSVGRKKERRKGGKE